MKSGKKEIFQLWDRMVEGKASARQRARFDALLKDPRQVEALADWQVAQVALPASLLSSKAMLKKTAKLFSKKALGLAGGTAAKGGTTALVLALASTAGLGSWVAVKVMHAPAAVVAPAVPVQASPFPPSKSKAPLPSPDENKSSSSGEGRGAVPKKGGEARSAPSPKRRLSVVLKQAKAGPVEVKILDSQGGLLRLLYSGSLDAGDWELDWDGRDDSGQALSPGTYRVEASVSGKRQESSLVLDHKP